MHVLQDVYLRILIILQPVTGNFTVDMSKLDLDEKGEQADRKATIHELPEGYLGRLQILKSGRARLMVGDVPFDVSLNSKSGFLQVRPYEGIEVSSYL